jgi:hypothetical protein
MLAVADYAIIAIIIFLEEPPCAEATSSMLNLPALADAAAVGGA